MAQKHRCGTGSRSTRRRYPRPERLCCESLESRRVLAASLSLVGPSTVLLEGERAEFRIELSERLKTAESVTITTVPGTAIYGSDYFAPSVTTLLFGPGQQSKTFAIPLLRDALREQTEGIETFQVVVTPATRGLGVRSATVRIADYVRPPTINVSGGSLAEGNSGSAPLNFAVSLSNAYPKDVTVAYATRNGSATVADLDYQAVSGTLTFAPGETTKTVSVQINGDTSLESDETFSLVLSNATNAVLGRSSATATIVNDETDQPGFQITVDYITSFYGEVPASVRNATQQAVQRWQQVITADVPGYMEVSTGRFVDDFRMRVQMGLLGGGSDGGGGALANAIPVQYRPGGLPWLGDTGIDPADVSNPQLVGILLHEIGHALGFAPGNQIYDRWVTGTTWTGPNAVREYGLLAGSARTSVPLETGGGGGTAGAHWSEAVFDSELMTGYAEAGGVPMPLSRLTIGAFADLGYVVNYAAADAYTLPSSPPPVRAPVVVPGPRQGSAAGNKTSSMNNSLAFSASTATVTAKSEPARLGPEFTAPRQGTPRVVRRASVASIQTEAFASLGSR